MLPQTALQSMITSHFFNQNRGHILPTLGYNELLQTTSNLQKVCNRQKSNKEKHSVSKVL